MISMLESTVEEPENLPTYQKGFHYEDKIRQMPYRNFGRTGLQVSLLGFGGSELAFCHGTPKEEEGIMTVVEAIKSGINYIDTAPYYGHGKAETVLGKALKRLPRNAYFIATKVGRYGPNVEELFDFSADRITRSVEESLIRLGLDAVDVLLAHDIEYAASTDIIVNETLPTLQKLKDAGKTKFIGITGYPLRLLKEVLMKSSVQIDVILSYCRCTLFDDTLKSYIPYFKEKNVAVVSAAGLGMGLLTNGGPPDWHPVEVEIKEACREAAEYCSARNVNIAKLAAHHCYVQPDINVHLIGMEKKHLLEVNLDTLFNGLTPHEMAVKEEIFQKYFSPLPKNHWEDKDVIKYWEELKKVSSSRTSPT
ncbi:uncharacterized protein LOC129217549 [Uloborus diversus]|uniref:uncharacterized protein LOC129217549 n=1 Tax=Uloborus diversus TaxID=327109 RepID=UPI002409B38A|nr:uncharacterized protein LOC129217549 [Uloborus diversus]